MPLGVRKGQSQASVDNLRHQSPALAGTPRAAQQAARKHDRSKIGLEGQAAPERFHDQHGFNGTAA